ncbi:chromate efflux transporter [Alisedimentitalea sp. MJ-SS2]|uniref:chromate efflux transporter n=1 Tax=Aliisedimentitalea sp. MJ-SS2 TaxID=3049795 RepID=UPI002914DFCC|nr:chromate efflux transporter [Alisedimentitalea sp. MJ-SS2]MDU8929191.1 chromate efflux transporter [Alisedimentitalea sp. MJ-SS2]
MTTPSLAALTRVFGRIGILSFGGPAAQIALMHRELVELRDWMSEKSFLGALSFCMLLPGPEAMQLATYAGWRLRGTLGGLIAGLLFVIPGALIIAVLAMLYLQFGTLPAVQSAFLGIKATVIIIVIGALRKVAAKALTGALGWTLAILAFVAIYALQLPFPLIIALAALTGALLNTTPQTHPRPTEPVRHAHTLRTIAIWLTLWSAPILLCMAFNARFLTDIALYFSQLAVLTFGGAYAVLAWMTQSLVVDHGWITTGQMIDALGLAETTPGPLILVTEFTAILAGHGQGGIGLALTAGALTLWVTFVPCFLWIFAGAPYVEHLLSRPRLQGALTAITAAVVGVIANLSLWFALHALFAQTLNTPAGPMPVFASLNLTAALLTVLAALLLMILRWPMIPVLAAMALAGLGAGHLSSFL